MLFTVQEVKRVLNIALLMLILCLALQKEALMEQVAHQAVVMQFILEMASNSQQDPRGCFRQFFHKAKVSHRQFIYCIMYLYLLSLYCNYDPRLYKQIFYMLLCRRDRTSTLKSSEQNLTPSNKELKNMQRNVEMTLWTLIIRASTQTVDLTPK